MIFYNFSNGLKILSRNVYIPKLTAFFWLGSLHIRFHCHLVLSSGHDIMNNRATLLMKVTFGYHVPLLFNKVNILIHINSTFKWYTATIQINNHTSQIAATNKTPKMVTREHSLLWHYQKGMFSVGT